MRLRRKLGPADAGHVPEEAIASTGERERHGDLGVALDELDDGALLVEQTVLVLAEPVEALPAVPVEGDLTRVEIPSRPAIAPLRRRREVRDALGEQRLPVRPQEAHERREVREPLLRVVVDLDDEIAVAHPRPVAPDLDRGAGRTGLARAARSPVCR